MQDALPARESRSRAPAQAAELTDHQWTLEEVVAMVDAYHTEKENAEFEAAFEAKLQKPRLFPKTYKPTPKSEIKLPWYLDVNSGGLKGEPESP